MSATTPHPSPPVASAWVIAKVRELAEAAKVARAARDAWADLIMPRGPTTEHFADSLDELENAIAKVIGAVPEAMR